MSSRKRPSTTSLPPSPSDDESSRFRKYMVTMGIRVACLFLMVVVQPFGWYTWIFAAGAIVLPYIAVVLANVGKDAHEQPVENPERALPAAPSAPPTTDGPPSRVIRIAEAGPTAGPGAGPATSDVARPEDEK